MPHRSRLKTHQKEHWRRPLWVDAGIGLSSDGSGMAPMGLAGHSRDLVVNWGGELIVTECR